MPRVIALASKGEALADSDISVTSLDQHRWLITLTGEHDISTAPHLNESLDRIFATGTVVVLDLSHATFIDSTILHALLAANIRAEKTPGEELAIVIPDDSISARVIDLAGLRNHLPIYQNRNAALNAISAD